MNAWTLRHNATPITENAQRRMHHMQRAAFTREWRQTFAWLARAHRIPRLNRISITIQPYQTRGRIGDIGSIWPTAKAAIDGIVDAHVIPDDDPNHLIEIRLRPAIRGAAGLELHIIEETEQKESIA